MSLVAISTLFFKLLDSVEKGRSYEKILKKFNRDRKIHGTSENKLDELGNQTSPRAHPRLRTEELEN